MGGAARRGRRWGLKCALVVKYKVKVCCYFWFYLMFYLYMYFIPSCFYAGKVIRRNVADPTPGPAQ